MFDDQDAEGKVFTVLVNDEEQYSLWPKNKEIPNGWRACPIEGTKDTCLNYVNETWVDMRPRSLREHMAGKS